LRKLTILISVLALVAFAGSASAKPGGIQVDDDSGCGSKEDIEEVNLIDNGSVIYVWYNSNTNNAGTPTEFDWELFDNGEWVGDGTATRICTFDEWGLYEIDLPFVGTKKNGKPETVTLYSFDGNGDNVGGDSFRIQGVQG